MTSDPQATIRMEHAPIAGRYQLEGVIASGGVATVFKAADLLLRRDVAVKFLKDAADCDEDRARFILETRTLARLAHPGLVTMLDAGTRDGRPYLVMELVDGPSMSAVLGSQLDLTRAAEIGAQVARALDYAHGHGIVHRDVKPGNVLLRSDGRAKLADFGIARVVGEGSEYTRTGVVVGSVHYLAPEQVAFEEITPAVDVYALGLLLLRAVTGHHAFDGPTIETALARLSATPPVPTDLPYGWQLLLAAMTARRPEDRPTAAEVAERLTRLSEARPTVKVLPPPPRVTTRTPTRPTKPARAARRRRRVSPVAVAAAMLTIALYAAASLAGGPGEADASDGAAAASEPSASPTRQARTAGDAAQPVTDVRPIAPTTTPHHHPKAGAAKHHKHHKHDKHQGKRGKGKH